MRSSLNLRAAVLVIFFKSGSFLVSGPCALRMRVEAGLEVDLEAAVILEEEDALEEAEDLERPRVRTMDVKGQADKIGLYFPELPRSL